LDNQQLKEIFSRYLENRCSEEEVEMLMHYFHTDNYFYLRQLIDDELEKSEVFADDQYLQDAAQEVFVHIRQRLSTPDKNKYPWYLIRSYWAKISIAASLIIISAATVHFFSTHEQPDKFPLTTKYSNDLAPGQNKALLTLENGKCIALTDKPNIHSARLLKGMIVHKAADGQLVYTRSETGKNERPALNSLKTPNGGQYQLRLADGTKVWLNAASTLTYPTSFNVSGPRTVKLNGEAYFEVAHQKMQPFVVKTNQQEIKVLGTHFNIKAYSNEVEQETTLLDGSIKVSVLENSIILIPGQQAQTLKNSTAIQIVPFADTGMAIAWKEGVFSFDNTGIEKVMQQVARWYDAEIIYEGKKPTVRFTGVVQRNNNLSHLLDILQIAGKIKFDIRGNKIIVKNKN
jgi:transmembrane sensor